MARSSDAAAPAVVLSILETDPGAVRRRLEAAPRGCGIVEIRADRLRATEIGGLVGAAPVPAIVTVRRPEDGGTFDGSEEERRAILEAGLAAGAAWIDVEWNGPLASLADGPMADRVILSHHGGRCDPFRLRRLVAAMAGTRAARLKVVPHAERATDAAVLEDLLREANDARRRLTAFATGEPGMATRVFAPSWGGWGTFGSADPGAETASGQIPVDDLLDVYDVLSIGPATRRFALAGSPVAGSPSPAMHAAAFRAAGIDARYLPIEASAFDEAAALAGPAGALCIEGLACTIPLKEEAASRTEAGDPIAASARAVNTVTCRGNRWTGFNTDGPGAVELVRSRLDPSSATVAVVGAGGTGRAIAAALAAVGARTVLYNRNAERGREAARRLGVEWRALEEVAAAEWDVLVQATPLGKRGETVVPKRSLNGRLVIDAVYGPRPTPLVRDARDAGIEAFDGVDLLVAQGVLQFARFTGHRPDRGLMEAAARRWLSARADA